MTDQAMHAIRAARLWKQWGRWTTIQYLNRRKVPHRLWYLARQLEEVKNVH